MEQSRLTQAFGFTVLTVLFGSAVYDGIQRDHRAAVLNRLGRIVLEDSTVPVTGVTRLRSRAKWVNSLQRMLGWDKRVVGRVLSGWWTPDLIGLDISPSFSYLSALLRDGAKFLGGGLLDTELVGEAGAEVRLDVPFVELSLGGVPHVVVPDLLGRLSSYAFLRRRDNLLVSGLRARALEWFKEHGVTDRHTSLAMPSTVALACLESGPESAAAGLMSSRSAGVLGDLFPYLVRPSRWWEKQG
jgi:hypothetical protein